MKMRSGKAFQHSFSIDAEVKFWGFTFSVVTMA